jgi:hypothetical protein
MQQMAYPHSIVLMHAPVLRFHIFNVPTKGQPTHQSKRAQLTIRGTRQHLIIRTNTQTPNIRPMSLSFKYMRPYRFDLARR